MREQANRRAVELMCAAQPVLLDVRPAREVVPDMAPNGDARALARFILDVLLPRVRRETPLGLSRADPARSLMRIRPPAARRRWSTVCSTSDSRWRSWRVTPAS